MKILLACALAMTSAVILAADLPTPGMYKITAKVSSQQLPISSSHDSSECITENQFLEDPQAWMRQQSGQECEVVNYEVGGGVIHMELQCSMDQGGKASIIGNGTYTNTSFEINNQMSIEANGMKMEMNTAITGVRQGEC